MTDQLNTHRPAALYQAFPPADAWRLLEKLKWHYTPTHGSWLNMAALEWSVLSRQCLHRRIPDQATLEAEVTAWVAARNAEAVTTSWHFTKAEARQRLQWLYPHPAHRSPSPGHGTQCCDRVTVSFRGTCRDRGDR